jgi:tetratricopeptide (TPR) repeat protein
VITPGADPAEFELWVAFQEVRAMDHSEARTELIEDLVRRADAGDVRRMTFRCRRFLAHAYQLHGRWHLVYLLFRECLDEYDRRPWRFESEDQAELLGWYAWLAECMVDFPDYGLPEIHATLDDVERRFRAAGYDLHVVHGARRGVAAHIGDWEAAERAHLHWAATAPLEGDDRWLHVAEIEQLLARGDDESVLRAHSLAAPMLADPTVTDDPVVVARFLMLLPLARAGLWEQATLTYRRVLRGMAGEVQNMEHLGLVIEFCALTGNEDAGVDQLGVMKGFELKRPLGTMEFAASVAVLASVMVRTGRGGTRLDLGDDPHSGPWRVVADRMRRLALEIADRFDRRNGTSVQGARIRARLESVPLAEFVPLLPTRLQPLRLVPPGLSDAELLDRAQWHNLRCELTEARACLGAVSSSLPEHLAARQAELAAMFLQGPDTEAVLLWAADVHRQQGDSRRALLLECWLGPWIVHSGRASEGVAVVSEAVAGLRVLGDDSACAWGEHWLAHVLVGQGLRSEALEAVSRGKRHAEAAGDLLALGTLLELEGRVHPSDVLPAALVAFLGAGAMEKALEVLGQPDSALVDQLLANPVVSGRLLGHLRYLRACALFDGGQVASAVDDLNSAIGHAALRGDDTVEQWFRLTHANFAAQRYEDAVDSGSYAANWLDHLEDAAWGDWADQARYLVAESYRLLGDRRAALREYRTLANGNGALAATAFVAATALLEELGAAE